MLVLNGVSDVGSTLLRWAKRCRIDVGDQRRFDVTRNVVSMLIQCQFAIWVWTRCSWSLKHSQFPYCESFVMLLFMSYVRSCNLVKSTNIRLYISVNSSQGLPPSGILLSMYVVIPNSSLFSLLVTVFLNESVCKIGLNESNSTNLWAVNYICRYVGRELTKELIRTFQ